MAKFVELKKSIRMIPKSPPFHGILGQKLIFKLLHRRLCEWATSGKLSHILKDALENCASFDTSTVIGSLWGIMVSFKKPPKTYTFWGLKLRGLVQNQISTRDCISQNDQRKKNIKNRPYKKVMPTPDPGICPTVIRKSLKKPTQYSPTKYQLFYRL